MDHSARSAHDPAPVGATPIGSTLFDPMSPGPTPPGPAAGGATRSERQARANWLITELGRLAANADNPHEQARFRRTADSLVRLATAFRS